MEGREMNIQDKELLKEILMKAVKKVEVLDAMEDTYDYEQAFRDGYVKGMHEIVDDISRAFTVDVTE